MAVFVSMGRRGLSARSVGVAAFVSMGRRGLGARSVGVAAFVSMGGVGIGARSVGEAFSQPQPPPPPPPPPPPQIHILCLDNGVCGTLHTFGGMWPNQLHLQKSSQSLKGGKSIKRNAGCCFMDAGV